MEETSKNTALTVLVLINFINTQCAYTARVTVVVCVCIGNLSVTTLAAASLGSTKRKGTHYFVYAFLGFIWRRHHSVLR